MPRKMQRKIITSDGECSYPCWKVVTIQGGNVSLHTKPLYCYHIGVLSPLELRNKVQLVISEDDSQAYVDSTSYGRVQVNQDNCGCPYYTTMGPPCCHVHLLAYLQHLGMDLYVPDKCQHRWTRSCKPSNDRQGSVRVTVTEVKTSKTKHVSRTHSLKGVHRHHGDSEWNG